MSERDRLLEVADKLAIIEVLHRYAKGLDSFDGQLAASCYSPEARFEIDGEVITGRDRLAAYFDDTTGTRKRQTGLDPVELFSHVMSNALVDVDGDRARCESFVTAYVIGRREGDRVMLVRGVRYRDELVREDGRWLLLHRHHELRWMYDTEPTFVAPGGR